MRLAKLWLNANTYVVSLVTLLVGLLVTLVSYQIIDVKESEAARLKFERTINDTARDIAGAMKQYERLLQASSSYVLSVPGMKREQWRTFSDHLQLAERYPGLLGLGYAPFLPSRLLPEHIQAIRSEGFPAYDVTPPGEREAYTPIALLEPFSGRNLKAFGFDMYSENVRRAAMDAGRDAGSVALSGKLLLVQEGENPQPGTIMYLPVYKGTGVPLTIEERRSTLQGFVYSPFRMPDLMSAALGERVGDMALQLFDGDTTIGEALLYERRMDILRNLPSYHPAFDETLFVEVGQRIWTLRLTTLPAFDLATPAGRSRTVLGAGVVLSVLLSGLLWSALTTRARAQALADQMTQAMKESEANSRAVVDSAAEGILITDCNPGMAILDCNAAAERLLGFPKLSVVQKALSDVIAFDEKQQMTLADVRSGQRSSGRIEVQLRSADGTYSVLALSVTATLRSGARNLIIVVADLTDLYFAQREALQASIYSQSILFHSPFAIISTDLGGTITGINPAGEQLVGYPASDLIKRSNILLIHDPAAVRDRCAVLSEEAGEAVAPLDLLVAEPRDLGSTESEWTYLRKDGLRVPVHQVSSVIKDTEGKSTGLLHMAYDITERKRTEEQVRHMALHDPLTGLPNRNLLGDRLDMALNRAMRNSQLVGVMQLDLDRFKHINDHYGHQMGDEVLKAAAARISGAVRQIDTVVRTGGDEFIVLLGELTSKDDAGRIAQAIIASVTSELIISGNQLELSTSIGVAIYPHHGTDAESLLRVADNAMYEVKKSGRNAYHVPAST